jgi:hypothetical protein
MPSWLTRASRSVLDGDGGRDTRRFMLLWLRVPARQKEKGVALDEMVLLLCAPRGW